MKFSLAFVAVLALTGAVCAGPVTKSATELHNVFGEFLELLPMKRINDILKDYIENDREINQMLQFIDSEDFKNLVTKAESIEELVKVFDYLEESGLYIYGAMNILNNALDLPPFVPGKPMGLRTTRGGLVSLVLDIEAVLPVNDIVELYYKKLITSASFAYFVQHLRSPKLYELVSNLTNNEEFVEVIHVANTAGLNVFAMVDLWAAIYGLGFEPLTDFLQKDISDFYKLLPYNELQSIQDKYSNDPEIIEIGRYLQTEEFSQKLQELESIKEVKTLFHYLQGSGINVYQFLEVVHEAVEIPAFQPTSRASKIGGVAGFVAEVKAVLPMKEIKALHQAKLYTSFAFNYFNARLTSWEYEHNLIAVFRNEQASDIFTAFKSHGLDVVRIIDLFMSVIGY